MKLVDMRALGARAFRRVGSSPTEGNHTEKLKSVDTPSNRVIYTTIPRAHFATESLQTGVKLARGARSEYTTIHNQNF